MVSLIPIFQYSNVYETTPRIHDFAKDKDLQDKCIRFVSKSGKYEIFLQVGWPVYHIIHINKSIIW